MAFFISANMRKCINEGRGDAVPIFLHDIPHLFQRKIIPVDVSVITVREISMNIVQRLKMLIIIMFLLSVYIDIVNVYYH